MDRGQFHSFFTNVISENKSEEAVRRPNSLSYFLSVSRKSSKGAVDRNLALKP